MEQRLRAVRRSAHSASQLRYHLVCPVKYRKEIFDQPDREQTLLTVLGEIEERYELHVEEAPLKLFDLPHH